MPLSVLTHTMPLAFAFSICEPETELAEDEECAEDLCSAGAAGALEPGAGAGALAGGLLAVDGAAAGASSAEPALLRLRRDFFAVVGAFPPASALLAGAFVPEVAVAELSLSPFFLRLFFVVVVVVAPLSAEAVWFSAAASDFFLRRLFLVPVSAAPALAEAESDEELSASDFFFFFDFLAVVDESSAGAAA